MVKYFPEVISDRDVLLEHKTVFRSGLTTLTASNFVNGIVFGYAYTESPEGIKKISSQVTEIIPIDDNRAVNISRRRMRYFKNSNFTVSTDRAFNQVVEHCSIPRDSDGKPWIGPRLKKAFHTAHAVGWMHSIEVWQNHELVGGLFGVGRGKFFSSLSVFSHVSHAGVAAAYDLLNRLNTAKYLLHDAIIPSNLSRTLGGRLESHDYLLRLKAADSASTFPMEPAIFPEEFPSGRVRPMRDKHPAELV